MNLINYLLIISLSYFSLTNLVEIENDAPQQMSYSDCIVKYRFAWGEDCSQCATWKDSYVAYLKNTCDQPIDVMICVQESNKEWKRFQHKMMASGDSLRAYACEGTGKYLAWARRAGDESVAFPTIDQVNKQYTD